MYLLLVAAVLIFQTGTAYKAAVYEHYPSHYPIIVGTTPIETINKNLNEYRAKAQTAEDKGADIIVFPEYGLTTVTTDPENYAIDIANDDTGVLDQLKAIAIEHGLYIVVNLFEKMKDNSSKTLYYNTNLVYNRKGNIVAKYRKINLYNEPKLTPGNETVTFSTDFGVTFGLFTCFDILFHKPSQTIFENDKVKDVVFPAAWHNTLPFYSSLSVQHGYAVANGVNLLAANYGKPWKAHGGSGIFSGNGQILETYIDSSLSSKLIIQSVPELAKRQVRTSCSGIVPQGLPIPDQQSNIAGFVTLKYFDSSKYVFEDIDITKEKVSKKVCQKDFCCNFEITIKDGNTNEHYKVLASDGLVSNDKVKDLLHIRVCSLVACKTDSKDSCGARVNGTTKFAIHVQGSLPSDELTFYRPLTLNYNLRPIEEINYCSNDNSNDTSNVEVKSTRPQKGVLAFGILGRAPSSGVQNMGIVALILAALAKLILLY